MKKYLIYTCQGTGGMFISAVLGLIHNYDVRPAISPTGDCHNMTGQNSSIWCNTRDFNCIGLYPENFLSNRKIYYAHVIDIDKFKREEPDVKIIFIGFSPDDVLLITKLYVNKVWPILWSQDEYNKWAGPDWPPFSPDNITTSSMIRNELIADLACTTINPWMILNQQFKYDHYLPFKTIFGLNNCNLINELEAITESQITCEVRNFIVKYQETNKKLYIND